VASKIGKGVGLEGEEVINVLSAIIVDRFMERLVLLNFFGFLNV